MAGHTFTLQSIVLISLATVVFSYTDCCEPPTIVEPQARVSYYHKENERVAISCTATGTPSPTYEWRLNDKPISSNTTTYDKVTGTLTISSLSVKEEGFFKCHASNSNPSGISATVVSQPVEIRVARVEEFKNTHPQTFSISEGNYLKIACDDAWPTYYGTTSFKWFIKKNDNSEINQDDRIFIDHDGALHFAYILKSDDVPGSTYHCAISNSAQGIIKLGRGNILSVTRSTTTVTHQKPRLIYKTNGKSLLHTEAVLECVFSGDINSPTVLPKIRWYDDVMTEIVSGGRYNIDSYGRKMTITNVQESDEKTYSCQGSNDVGSTTEKVFLDVTSTPIWVNSLKSQTVTEGETATFTCSARSTTGENPPETPKWFKNGLSLDSYDESKYVFSLDKKALQVMDVRKDNDYSCFQCSVSNSNGDLFANGCLRIIDEQSTYNAATITLAVLLTIVVIVFALIFGFLYWRVRNLTQSDNCKGNRVKGGEVLDIRLTDPIVHSAVSGAVIQKLSTKNEITQTPSVFSQVKPNKHRKLPMPSVIDYAVLSESTLRPGTDRNLSTVHAQERNVSLDKIEPRRRLRKETVSCDYNTKNRLDTKANGVSRTLLRNEDSLNDCRKNKYEVQLIMDEANYVAFDIVEDENLSPIY